MKKKAELKEKEEEEEEECKKGNGIKGNLCIGRFRYLRVNVSKAMQFNISQNELSNSTPCGENGSKKRRQNDGFFVSEVLFLGYR
jgi:hypothetical protein